MALIPPVSAVATQAVTPSVATVAPSAASSAGATQRSNDFENAIGSALDTLNSQQLHADQLAKDAATGKLQNVEEYMLAATEAQLGTQLTVAVRNKAVEAFNEIMRMQV
ncbi:MAG: flagellar hook-basal body complex protein FliE [Acidimicrobiales bacterium]